MLYQTLRPFDYHFGDSFVMLRQLIKCGINNLHIRSFNCFPEIRNFLRPFINQKDDQVHVRIIYFYGLRNLLEQRCLTSFRRRYDHTSLPFSHRAHQIHDPHGR